MVARTPRWVLTKFGCAIVLALVLAGGYFSVGHGLEPHDGRHFLALPIDNSIPFIPATVWIYLPALVASIVLAVALIQDRHVFRAAVAAILYSSALNFTFFVAVPLAYPRPPLDLLGHMTGSVPYGVVSISGDSWSPLIVAWLYSFDPSSCTYPSFHVTFPVSFALALRYENRRAALVLALVAILLLIATWTTKQHFFVDGFAGALSAWLGHRLAFRRYRLTCQASTEKRMQQAPLTAHP